MTEPTDSKPLFCAVLLEKTWVVNAFCPNSALFTAVMASGSLSDQKFDIVKSLSRSDKNRLSKVWHTQSVVPMDESNLHLMAYHVHVSMLESRNHESEYDLDEPESDSQVDSQTESGSSSRPSSRQWASFRMDSIEPAVLTPDLWGHTENAAQLQALEEIRLSSQEHQLLHQLLAREFQDQAKHAQQVPSAVHRVSLPKSL